MFSNRRASPSLSLRQSGWYRQESVFSEVESGNSFQVAFVSPSLAVRWLKSACRRLGRQQHQSGNWALSYWAWWLWLSSKCDVRCCNMRCGGHDSLCSLLLWDRTRERPNSANQVWRQSGRRDSRGQRHLWKVARTYSSDAMCLPLSRMPTHSPRDEWAMGQQDQSSKCRL